MADYGYIIMSEEIDAVVRFADLVSDTLKIEIATGRLNPLHHSMRAYLKHARPVIERMKAAAKGLPSGSLDATQGGTLVVPREV